MAGIFTSHNGEWVEVLQPQFNMTGNVTGNVSVNALTNWAPVQQIFVNNNGTWDQIFPDSGTQTFNQAGTYTFTVPGGIYSITLDAAGGGGGGGGSMEVGNGDGGGGGGSGGYVQSQTFAVLPGETITILVGAGGRGAPFVGRTTAAPNGNAGGDTVINGQLGSIICTGGGAGLGGNEAEGGGCCFNPDARVLMADGNWKRIIDIVVGDKVMGENGHNTVINLATALVDDRKMVQITGYDFFSTDDHLFLTDKGWKTWRPDRLIEKKRKNAVYLTGENRTTPLQSGDVLITQNGPIAYDDLIVTEHDFSADYTVYDLTLSGDQTYIVDGFIVHNCGGGGSIICTKLYQLGYLTEAVYRADEKFGQLVRQTDPDVYAGYISWAGTIVRWMGDTSPAWLRWLTTTLTVIIARNWAQHMAYEMGAVEKDSLFGRFLMAVGIPFNRMLGKSKRTGINQCNTL